MTEHTTLSKISPRMRINLEALIAELHIPHPFAPKAREILQRAAGIDEQTLREAKRYLMRCHKDFTDYERSGRLRGVERNIVAMLDMYLEGLYHLKEQKPAMPTVYEP